MAASRLLNVRCSNTAVILTVKSSVRSSELKIHTKALRLARVTNNQVRKSSVQRKREQDESTDIEQAHATSQPAVAEEDFFGFIRGEGVTVVEPNQNGPVDVMTKYESLFSGNRPSDVEKMYVTNFGKIRLDRDNQAKFHGQFEVVREGVSRRQSENIDSDEFPEPQSDRQLNKGRTFNQMHRTTQDNASYVNSDKKENQNKSTSRTVLKSDSSNTESLKYSRDAHSAAGYTAPREAMSSSYVDEEYFGNQLMNDKNGEHSEQRVPPMDIGYFDKLYEREYTNTKSKQEGDKTPQNAEICDTNYTSYMLNRFKSDNVEKDVSTDGIALTGAVPHDTEANYLEANLVNYEKISGTEKWESEPSYRINENCQQSVVQSASQIETSNKSFNSANELHAESAYVNNESQSVNAPPKKAQNSENYRTDIRNTSSNERVHSTRLQLQDNKSIKPSFIEESIIEYTETSEYDQKLSTNINQACIERLQELPPFISNLKASVENRVVDEVANTFGGGHNLTERQKHPSKEQNSTSDHPSVVEGDESLHDPSTMIIGQEDVSEGHSISYHGYQDGNAIAASKEKTDDNIHSFEAGLDHSKRQKTIFGTHPELVTRQKTVASLAHAQRRSTTKPQVPPEPPSLDDDVEYVQPEDVEFPARDNIGLRVTVPEPRFDKKPKFASRQNSEEPVYADEFVAEYLKEEVTEESQEDRTEAEGSPLSLAKLQVKTQNLEEQPEFVVLQLLKDSVMYNNHDILVLYKPYGLPIQPSKGYRHNLVKLLPELASFVDHANPNPKLYTVHRIDRGTTGILVLAKTQQMANSLHSLFKNGKIHKTYWAITKGIPNPLQGIIKIPIAEGSVVGRRRMVLKPDYNEDTKLVVKKSSVKVHDAITPYRVLTAKGNAALVEATPQTGITHQIRVHFGFGLGCPLLGDHKYTHLTNLAPQRLPADMLRRLDVRQSKVRDLPIHLHSRAIVIPEILDGKNIYIQAGLPKHMQWAIRKLKLRKRS